MEQSLSILAKNKSISRKIVTGDFNIELIKFEIHASTGDYLEMLMQNGFLPIVLLPARATDHPYTLIDHIFTGLLKTEPNLNVTTYLQIRVTILQFFSILYTSKNSKKKLENRLFSEQNKLKLQEILKVIDWDLELGQRRTDEAMQIFYKEFQIAYSKTFPFAKLSRKRANDKPWISTALKNSIKQKHKLYQRFLFDQTLHNEMLYKAYKNKLKALIRKSEIKYYQNIFRDRKNNIKDMWKHLGFLLNSNKSNSQNKKSVSKLNIN